MMRLLLLLLFRLCAGKKNELQRASFLPSGFVVMMPIVMSVKESGFCNGMWQSLAFFFYGGIGV